MKEKDMALSQMKELYGDEGEIRLFFAPGRVNLIGEHTDYNGGMVLPCALSYGTYLAARRRKDREIHFYSVNMPGQGGQSSLDALVPETSQGWQAYPLGVFWAFQKHGYELPFGMDLVYAGNVPAGSGLSSSAAIEVVTAQAIQAIYGLSQVSQVEIAKICQYGENYYNGLSCGIMDQFASALGKKDAAIYLDTKTLEYEYVPVFSPKAPRAKLVIVNSMVKHSLVDSAYNERKTQCQRALLDVQEIMGINTLCDLTPQLFETYQIAIKDEECQKRARHVIYENERTKQAVKALQEGDLVAFGQLMNQSHQSMKEDYEVSCEQMDFLAEWAWQQEEVYGARMTGGGFGGCTINLVQADQAASFAERICQAYEERFQLKAKVYLGEIQDGAREISLEEKEES